MKLTEQAGQTGDGVPYTVRRSARAKHARLRLSPEEGLTVVVPVQFDLHLVPALVARQRDWLQAAEDRLRRPGWIAAHAGPDAGGRPDQIELSAIGESWRLSYVPHPGTPCRATPVERGGPGLRVSGAVEDLPSVRAALGRWLTRRARAALEPWVRELADERALTVPQVAVRSQRTRWASCSASGSISLNRALLFLSPSLVRHVMLHELCHRRQMDHSARFWELLLAEDPDARANSRELRTSWRSVPSWAR